MPATPRTLLFFDFPFSDDAGIPRDDCARLLTRLADGAVPYPPGPSSPGAEAKPGMWALLVAGFGIVGAALCRRKRAGLVP